MCVDGSGTYLSIGFKGVEFDRFDLFGIEWVDKTHGILSWHGAYGWDNGCVKGFILHRGYAWLKWAVMR